VMHCRRPVRHDGMWNAHCKALRVRQRVLLASTFFAVSLRTFAFLESLKAGSISGV
jgi:hypothetical protein